MRWVEVAAIRPNVCAHISYLGNSNARRGFWDFGTECPCGCGYHIYTSLEAAEEMARGMGWAPPLDQSTHERERARLQAKVEQLEAELADCDRQLQAVEVLKAGGFTAGRKPGRPAKQKAGA